MREKYYKQNPEVRELSKNSEGSISLAVLTLSFKERSESYVAKGKKKLSPLTFKCRSSTVDYTEDESEKGTDDGTLIAMDDVIDTLGKAVQMSGGFNKEAVFDLAETLWVAGQRSRAVPNYELATRADDASIQILAHLRLVQVFLDANDLGNADTHLRSVLKMEGWKDDKELKGEFLQLSAAITRASIGLKDVARSREWLMICLENGSTDSAELKQRLVYAKLPKNSSMFAETAHPVGTKREKR